MEGKADPWQQWAEDGENESVALTYQEEEKLSLTDSLNQELKIILIRFSGMAIPALLFSVPFFLLINEQDYEIFGLFFGGCLFIHIVVQTWRLSNKFNSNLSDHWEKTTPPHSNEFAPPNLKKIIRRKMVSFRTRQPKIHPNKDFSRCVSRVRAYFMGGILLFIVGLIIGMKVYESGFIDSSRSSFFNRDDYFLPVAYVSALLGPKFAAIIVTVFALSISSEDASVVVLLFILPAYYLIPAIKNGIIAIEVYFEDLLRG